METVVKVMKVDGCRYLESNVTVIFCLILNTYFKSLLNNKTESRSNEAIK